MIIKKYGCGMKYKNEWDELEKKLEKDLTESRFRHTLGVAYTATALAMRYGVNMDDARRAGLLHDCAKCMSNADMLKMAGRDGVTITDFEVKHPALLHAKVGVSVARKKYGVRDIAIMEAIRWHTTGKPDMTMLEKIIFTADYIEPNRNKAPNLDEIRKLAFEDIDRCVCKILSDTIEYLSANPKSMDPTTLRAYEYYKRKTGGL